eukprot:scaffold73579_cov75-Phaeocystis_antarctica.AAC.1
MDSSALTSWSNQHLSAAFRGALARRNTATAHAGSPSPSRLLMHALPAGRPARRAARWNSSVAHDIVEHRRRARRAAEGVHGREALRMPLEKAVGVAVQQRARVLGHVRRHHPQKAAGRQHAPALAQQLDAGCRRQVLEHVFGVDHQHRRVGKGKATPRGGLISHDVTA